MSIFYAFFVIFGCHDTWWNCISVVYIVLATNFWKHILDETWSGGKYSLFIHMFNCSYLKLFCLDSKKLYKIIKILMPNEWVGAYNMFSIHDYLNILLLLTRYLIALLIIIILYLYRLRVHYNYCLLILFTL